MSEQAPGQYPLSPSEKEILDAQDTAKIEEATKKLDELATTMGYVSVPTFEGLGLTPDRIKQFAYVQKNERSRYEKYYIVDRKDGNQAKIVAIPLVNGAYVAEFFSPVGFQGHGGNHDFSLSEMKGNMELHLNRSKDGNLI